MIAHARIVWPEIVAADATDVNINYSGGRARHGIDRCEHILTVCERFLEGQATNTERDAALEDRVRFQEICSASFGTRLPRR